MANITTPQDFKSGEKTKLAVNITATQTASIKFAAMTRNGVETAWSTTSGIVEIREVVGGEEKVEWMSFNGITENSDKTVTLTTAGVGRGLDPAASNLTASGTGQSFSKNAEVRLVVYHYSLNQKADVDRANTFSAAQTFDALISPSTVTFTTDGDEFFTLPSLTTAERDALAPANGMLIYNETTSVSNQYVGGSWVTVEAGATENASTTVAGKVEMATDAEIRSATGAGGSGALVAIPASATAVLKDDRIVLQDSSELTISTGVITVTQPYHSVDTESDASGDALITITADVGAGEMIYLRLANSSRMVLFKDGDGNLIIPGGDYTLADADEILCFIYDGTNWRMIGPRESKIGEMRIWPTDTAPTGWLLCHGQAPDASTNAEYQSLFDAIGVAFGGTDNSDFTVPDMRGRFPLGQDDMGGSGANRVTAAAADTVGSSGGVDDATHKHHASASEAIDAAGGGGTKYGYLASGVGDDTGNPTTAGEAIPPYLTLNYIIRF